MRKKWVCLFVLLFVPRHVDEVLALITALSGSDEFEEIAARQLGITNEEYLSQIEKMN